jgi:hypothetical protein
MRPDRFGAFFFSLLGAIMSNLHTVHGNAARGLFTRGALDAIIAQFPPSMVHAHESIIVVRTENGAKVLSAAKVRGGWHVMAVDGLISIKS